MRSFAATGIGAALLAISCSLSPKDDPSQFYVLTATHDSSPTASSDQILGLGPIALPAYLLRPQMVTRVNDNQITLAEYQRWGENLTDGFTRVLAEQLKQATGARQVLQFPWLVSLTVDYSIEIDVSRFEGNRSGLVDLLAGWRIRDGLTRGIVSTGDSHFSQQAASDTPEAVVVAQSQVMAALSRELAAALRNIEQ